MKTQIRYFQTKYGWWINNDGKILNNIEEKEMFDETEFGQYLWNENHTLGLHFHDDEFEYREDIRYKIIEL